ncbi:hypothetical protein H4S02_007075 [Coemansia sp. RSA 2611]|nr:hypothetical protein H4S02_007075 [Coemansia sp. RSA 2611]KAJ2417570.1 hypothetical protein GGI10_000086 [Coemansia sp. RSA 2530]KAJ2696022.1 hypothetical protein H4218_004865 [Coemansia sp. IMI 209128]
MRYFLGLALASYFAALISHMVAFVYAANSVHDYVFLSNDAYQNKTMVYYKSDPVCINVDGAFNGPGTFVITRGRPVELFAGADCMDKAHTSRASVNGSGFWQSLRSFKVGAE